MDREETLQRVSEFVRQVQSILELDAVYVFGSVVDGHVHRFSDIDVALFVTTPPPENPLPVLKTLYRIADGIDPRIEPHLFHLHTGLNRFAETIRRTGIRIA